jgi:hypothetical protein
VDFTPEDDPLPSWKRKASWDRTVAYRTEDACGYIEPWQELPCDFTKGHNTLDTTNGRELASGGHNSTTIDKPFHLDAVSRVQRHHDRTSPLS